MKKQLLVLLSLVTVMSLAYVACAPQPSPAATQAPAIPSPTRVPKGSVAILVFDDFIDEVTDLSNLPLPDYETAVSKTTNKNCIYNISGQAAVISTGAAAVISTGAGVSSIPLPAPHGAIVFEELHSVINRVRDPSDSTQRANQEIKVTDGATDFPGYGFGSWMKTIIYFNNKENNKSIALVAVDTSNYATDEIALHLGDAINALADRGYSKFVMNMSFVIMPCPDLGKDPEITFQDYQKIIDDNQDLQYLQQKLSDLASKYKSGGLNLQSANLNLAFDPEFGPLRLLAYYQPVPFNPENFQKVLNKDPMDPLKAKILERSSAYALIPVAAAGNSGLSYPYAPAMWNEVLSVSAPVDGQDSNGLQLSNFNGDKGPAQFRTNSGEVTAEGCTTYKDGSNSYRIPGTSFSAPKVSYLAALYLLRGGSVSCTGSSGIYPVTTLGYAQEDGTWANLPIKDASVQYCSSFPFDIDLQQSCQ